MRSTFTAALILAALAACAPSRLSLPVVGVINGDENMQGEVVMNFETHRGLIRVETLDGFRCSGDYDATLTDATIRIPVTCSDGRTGTVLSTRDSSMIAGTAVAKLDDGTEGSFLFGVMTAEEQARFLVDAKRAK